MRLILTHHILKCMYKYIHIYNIHAVMLFRYNGIVEDLHCYPTIHRKPETVKYCVIIRSSLLPVQALLLVWQYVQSVIARDVSNRFALDHFYILSDFSCQNQVII
jgi:hypothetical protein